MKGTTIALDQPFHILLELVQQHKLDPWDVDLEQLTRAFLKHIEGAKPDLRSSGRAILSASILLRMKAERVLNNDGLSSAPEELEDIPLVDLPEIGPVVMIQHAARKITLVELLGALREALREVPPPRRRLKRGIEAVVRPVSEFHINLERYLNDLYARVLELSKGGETTLTELITERTRLGVVRTLLLVLILSARGKLVLRQEEPFGEVFVSPMEGVR